MKYISGLIVHSILNIYSFIMYIYIFFLNIYTYIMSTFQLMFSHDQKFIIHNDKDVTFSLMTICCKKNKNGTLLTNLPVFLIPGLNLEVKDMIGRKKYMFSYKHGVIDWNKFFNKLESSNQVIEDLD